MRYNAILLFGAPGLAAFSCRDVRSRIAEPVEFMAQR